MTDPIQERRKTWELQELLARVLLALQALTATVKAKVETLERMEPRHKVDTSDFPRRGWSSGRS